MRKKISVVVPVYNVEKYVGKCLESILHQTMQDFEVIVVDDCSPDGSMTVVKSYADKDPRFRIVTHEVNRGLMQARKSGYSVAEGEYLMFLDSDDFLPSDAMEAMYAEALRTSADVVSGELILFYPETGKEVRRTSCLKYGSDSIAVYKSLLLSEYHHNLCGKLFKTNILQSFEYKTLEHFTNGEDGYLFYQVVEHVKKVVHLEKPVYYYLQNMQSSSKVRLGGNAIRSICLLNQLRIEIADRHPEIKPYACQQVTRVLNFLYSKGYDKDAGLDSYVKEFGLSDYASFSSAFKHLPFAQACKVFIKRYLLKR